MASQDIQKMLANINSFRDKVIKAGPVPMEGIDKVEGVLGIKFPEEYRVFLNQFGAIKLGGLTIYGISFPTDCEPSIVWALKRLWNAFPDMPRNLIPIREANQSGAVVCILCPGSEQTEDVEAPIVIWSPDPDSENAEIIFQSENFAAYLSQLLIEFRHRKTALELLERHVEEFERDYLSIGKLPRNHVWRPYRFCSQDVVLGLTVVRHSIDNNCLEVDLCLTSEVAEFEEGSGAMVTTAFLLSEAYKCGGTMEIRFTENVENQRVPSSICELASRYGVNLEHVSEGRITPTEAKELYVAITEFGTELRDQINVLATAGKLSKERAAYVVHHGLWTKPELEHLILGCSRVDKLLSGEAQPEQRHLYLNDILHARAAIMGGFLDRKLAKKEHLNAGVALDLEDDIRPVEIKFDRTYYAKIYTCPETLPIPWLNSDGSKSIDVNVGTKFFVLLRARDAEDLYMNLFKDINLAVVLRASLGPQSESYIIGCLVPRDFEDLPEDLQKKLMSFARSQEVHILVCPETTAALDTDANRRMISSRIMRE